MTDLIRKKIFRMLVWESCWVYIGNSMGRMYRLIA